MEFVTSILKMVLLVLLCVKLVGCEDLRNSTDECPNVKTPMGMIRKRRYLGFPDGSNVVMTISVVKAFMTHAPSGWNLALEIDVFFPLPNVNFTSSHFRKKLHHRQKRDVWDRLSQAIDLHNFNGQACIMRSVCEAKTHLAPPGVSLVHDLLRAVFTAPTHDPEFLDEIGGTYNDLLDSDPCDRIKDCPFSILSFMLTLNKQKT